MSARRRRHGVRPPQVGSPATAATSRAADSKKPFSIANPSLIEEFCNRTPNRAAAALKAVEEICRDPLSRPPAVKHLKAEFYCTRRKRFGDFRIRYTFDPAVQTIRLLVIGPRSSVYD
jgi:mRNA-degrading endonuclease RelE of RelBE toxin-antitoxin system